MESRANSIDEFIYFCTSSATHEQRSSKLADSTRDLYSLADIWLSQLLMLLMMLLLANLEDATFAYLADASSGKQVSKWAERVEAHNVAALRPFGIIIIAASGQPVWMALANLAHFANELSCLHYLSPKSIQTIWQQVGCLPA